MRVFLARAAQPNGRIRFEPEFNGIEADVLVRKDERRGQVAIAERVGDWR